MHLSSLGTFVAGFNRLDDQIFVNRTSSLPSLLAFHPYENFLSVAEKDTVRYLEIVVASVVSYVSCLVNLIKREKEQNKSKKEKEKCGHEFPFYIEAVYLKK